MKATKVPHPGSACCDPNQDLAGWVAQETIRLDRADRWARVLSQKGQRLRRAATMALAQCRHARSADLDAESMVLCSTAMAIWQSNLARRGDLDRVVEAHEFRLAVRS